jgi:hypothetical protein
MKVDGAASWLEYQAQPQVREVYLSKRALPVSLAGA